MNIFLAGSEFQCLLEYVLTKDIKPINHLFSFYYIHEKNILKEYLQFKSKSKRILIDSGAHTFHTAKNIDFTEYTRHYCEFIQKYDDDNVVGYFEMDIDNRIGYKNVLKLRKIMEETTDKVIPVWHKNRGFNNFKKMCSNYDYVSISCLPIEGIPDTDLIKFVNTAHDYNCKIHGLGGTRKFILNNVPFDSVDSASWLFSAVNKRYEGKRISSNVHYKYLTMLSFLTWRKKQIFYEKYWREKNRRINYGKI